MTYDQVLIGATLASASTLPAQGPENFFPVSGAATISFVNVSGMLPGKAFELYFSSGLLLVHNAGSPPGGTVPLQLLTGANVTVAAQQVARFRYFPAIGKCVQVAAIGAGNLLPADQVAVGNGSTLIGSNNFQFNSAKGLFLGNRNQETGATATMSANTLVLGAGNQNFFRGTADIHGILATNWQFGARVTVVFQPSGGAVTLRHFSGSPGAGAEGLGLQAGVDVVLSNGSLHVIDFVFNQDNLTWMQVNADSVPSVQTISAPVGGGITIGGTVSAPTVSAVSQEIHAWGADVFFAPTGTAPIQGLPPCVPSGASLFSFYPSAVPQAIDYVPLFAAVLMRLNFFFYNITAITTGEQLRIIITKNGTNLASLNIPDGTTGQINFAAALGGSLGDRFGVAATGAGASGVHASYSMLATISA